MRSTALFSLLAACAFAGACTSSAPAASNTATAPAVAGSTASASPAVGTDVYAIFDTSKGKFEAELFGKDAPQSVDTIVQLAEGRKPYKDPLMGTIAMGKLYDGLLFFRTVPDALIQFGDPLNNGTGSLGIVIPVEKNDLKFDQPGRIGMAQIADTPSSRGSQLFITLQAAPALDKQQFLVVGQVVDGIDVVKALSEGDHKSSDIPTFPNVLNHVTIQDHK